LRILYFTSVDASDDMAPSVHVRGTCKALKNLGHSVALIHASPSKTKSFAPDWLDLISDVPWPEIRGGWKLFQIHAAFRLVQITRTWKPDVIYIRSALGKILEAGLRQCKVSVVLEVNGSNLLENPNTQRSLKVCDRILVDNSTLADDLRESFPEHGDKIRIHLTFVTDADHFRPIDRVTACETLGLDPGVLRLLHVSSFQPWHDFDTMITAVQELEKRFQIPIELRLIGDGPLRKPLLKRIVSEGLDKLITIPGRVKHFELPGHIAMCSAAIDLFTSDRLEGGKNLGAYKIYEYMACQRPVITAVSSNYSPPDWARDNLALIPPEDSEALIAAIETITDYPSIWEEKATHARNHVRTHNTWRAATETTLVHLEELMTTRRAPYGG